MPTKREKNIIFQQALLEHAPGYLILIKKMRSICRLGYEIKEIYTTPHQFSDILNADCRRVDRGMSKHLLYHDGKESGFTFDGIKIHSSANTIGFKIFQALKEGK